MILVEVSDATGENDSVKSTPRTWMYPFIKFLDFRRIKPSASSLLFNTHLTSTVCLPLDFTTLFSLESSTFLIKIIYFWYSRNFPQISIWHRHRFLEGIRFSSVHRNWRTAHSLNFVIFLLHDWNESRVYRYLIISLYDWIVHLLHSWVVRCIYILHCIQ